MKDVRLRPCIAQGDFEGNFDALAKMFAKVNFLYPATDSIRLYDVTGTYDYHDDATIPVVIGEDAVLTATKSASTTDYTLTLTGEIPKMSAATKAALYGAEASQTNATAILIEVPTGDISKLGFKRGSTDVTLEAGDVIEINNRFYLAHVIGLYDSTGTITTETTAMTLTYGLNSISYAVVVADATLEA